jgi:dUTP pyrophosphatase
MLKLIKMIKVKIKKVHPNAIIPKYAHEGDAGLDLVSVENLIVKPGEKVIVKTGLSMQIPSGNVGLIWDRSGMAAKYSMHTLAGVIDSGYRGEVGIVMINLSEKEFEINAGDRIAQMLIQPIIIPEIEEVKETGESSRGDGGFGSTGMN